MVIREASALVFGYYIQNPGAVSRIAVMTPLLYMKRMDNVIFPIINKDRRVADGFR